MEKDVEALIDKSSTSSFKWTEINFGRFAGKQMSLPRIVLTDPDWFWYMFEKEAFTGAVAREASDIAAKARKIRIPGKNPQRWKVLNYLTPEGAFSHFDVVEAKQIWTSGSPKSRSPTLSIYRSVIG